MFLIKNYNLLLKPQFMFTSTKFKHKDTHWSVQLKKKNATNKALEHFDDFYKTVFGSAWHPMRQALLAEAKYMAVINNFSESEKIMEQLENNGAVNVRTLINLQKQYQQEQQQQVVVEEPHIQVRKNEQKDVDSDLKHVATFSSSVADSLKTAEIDSSRIIYPGVNSADLSSALHEFLPATKLKGKEDWIPETQYYRYYEDKDSTSNSPFEVQIEKETDLPFPEHLNVYCYEHGNKTRFDSPRKGITGVLDYYLLNGASLLPLLALGLQPGTRLLDMCCAPAGKALMALQTLYPDFVVCNDVDVSRVKRIRQVLQQYLYDLETKWFATGRVSVTQEDGQHIALTDALFDCVLVDVPCTNDRLSLIENDNNWFKASRTKERLQLPETQAALLSNALKLIRVGGTVVYSTCSLSPIQNDGVVHMALRHIWENTHLKIVVKDLSEALAPTECIFKYASPNLLRYGNLIIPYLPQNYGPMYFCKLQRVS